MTLACPGCGSRLRAGSDLLASGRASARCPRCGATVPLESAARAAGRDEPASGAPAIRVTCAECGTRLKAPAASAGGRSHCPKCRAAIAIPAVATPPAGHGPGDVSGAATMRIDSRALGVAGMEETSGAREGVDLRSFLRDAAPPRPAAVGGAGQGAVGDEDGGSSAGSLMRPPVAAIKTLAHEIRQAAEGIVPPFPGAAAVHGEPAFLVATASAPRGAPQPPAPIAVPSATPAALPRAMPGTAPSPGFPAWRGLVWGLLAGGLTGGALTAAESAGVLPASPWVLAPLPIDAGALGLPEGPARAALLAALGGLSGFIAAAAGSPRAQDRPLRVRRTAAYALLTGAAAGMLVALTGGGTGAPRLVSWLVDLLLAGLITTALERLIPSRPR